MVLRKVLSGHPVLGHPRVFYNLDGATEAAPVVCGYCGIKYVRSHHH
jgi:uncharacterized Zn-finger protein